MDDVELVDYHGGRPDRAGRDPRGGLITQNKLAVSIGVPPRRINEIVHGKRGITADTAIRLARYFGTCEELWMNLQSNHELRLERRTLRDKVTAITPVRVDVSRSEC